MHRRLVFFFLVIAAAANLSSAAEDPAVRLTIDISEARQVLRILDKLERRASVGEQDWRELFATEPYRRLKERETSIGAPFDDEQFKTFVRSDEARSRRAEWEHTLAQLRKADMRAIGRQVLEWLPEGARIQARVFAEIKPRRNSFVWAKNGEGPAIFLALDRQTQDQFENTVAHECHHIGLQSLEARQTAVRAKLPPRVATAMEWMTAFGEGEAMLAAAGSGYRHPHWADDAPTRARWDTDLMRFHADVARLDQFFIDILDGRLDGEETIRAQAAPFWGDAQGAWYTVGYEMSVLVERQFGRRAFLECLIDPRRLLTLYDRVAQAAIEKGARLPRWSPQLLARLGAASASSPAGPIAAGGGGGDSK